MYAFIGTMLFLLIFCTYAMIQETKDCKAKGGEIVGTGEYYPVSTLVGNTVVVQYYEETVCTK